MNFYKKTKSAFSLAEAILIMISLAVAIGAATPFITKKIINIQNLGSGSDRNHGRYEIFKQEFVKIDDDEYKKIYKPKEVRKKKNTKRYITVYEKLNSVQYKAIKGEEPVIYEIPQDNGSKRHYISTIYRIVSKEAIPIFNTDGSINRVQIKKSEYNNIVNKPETVDESSDGNKILDKSTNFVFEVSDVFYEKSDSILGKKLVRVVDGNYVQYYKQAEKNCENNNTECIFFNDNRTCKADDGKVKSCYIVNEEKNFNLPITEKPWIRKIIGNDRVVIDKELKDDEVEENSTTGQIKLKKPVKIPDNVKSVTFHAVGGGGASGTASGFRDKPITPKGATSDELKIIKHHLAEAFREYAKERYEALKDIDGAKKQQAEEYIKKVKDLSDDKIVTESSLTNSEGAPWISIDKDKGTISVKVDLRYGLMFPHQLLKYTYRLGAENQQPKTYHMPKWFTAEIIEDKGYHPGMFVCSSAGKAGPTYSFDAAVHCPKLDSACLGTEYGCHYKTNSCSAGTPGSRAASKTYKTNCCESGCTCTDVETEVTACSWTTINYNCEYEGGTYYGCGTKLKDYSGSSGSCGSSAACSSFSCAALASDNVRTDSTINYTFHGASGGRGICAWLAVKADDVVNISSKCGIGSGDDWSGEVKTPDGDDTGSFDAAREVGLHDDVQIDGICPKAGRGRSCTITAGALSGTYSVTAQGGTNGSACLQTLNKHNNVEDFATSIFGPLNEDIKKLFTGHTAYFSGDDDPSDEKGTICDFLGAGDGWIFSGKHDTQADIEGFTLMDTTKPWVLVECGFLPDGCGTHLEKTCGIKGIDGGVSWGSPVGKLKGTDYFGGTGKPQGTKETDSLGIGTDTTGIYNHIYIWTMPFAIDYLVYADGGKAGAYATTIKSDVTGNLYITLGAGGTKDKPNGSDTVIAYKDIKPDYSEGNLEIILTAKGGPGGASNKRTNNFNMCFATKKEDRDTDNELMKCRVSDLKEGDDEHILCCYGNKETYTTKDIDNTTVKFSELEKKASSTNNSFLVGLGLGRGAEGVGSKTYFEETGDKEIAKNVSCSGCSTNPVEIVSYDSPADTSPQNELLLPPYVNRFGAGGAVIIMW